MHVTSCLDVQDALTKPFETYVAVGAIYEPHARPMRDIQKRQEFLKAPLDDMHYFVLVCIFYCQLRHGVYFGIQQCSKCQLCKSPLIGFVQMTQST